MHLKAGGIGIVLWAAACGSGSTGEPAFDWPCYRGPARNGVSSEANWKTDWPEQGPKKLWDARLADGNSAPSISGGRLYVMGTEGDAGSEVVYCLDAETGKELWRHRDPVVRAGAPVSGTPCVAADRVYTYGSNARLHCFEAATGTVVWEKELAKDFPGCGVTYGYCASPVLVGGRVVVPIFKGQREKWSGGGPYPATGGLLMAYEAATGKEAWRCAEGASAWSTPAVGMVDGKETIVYFTGSILLGIAPADGKVLWQDDTLGGRDICASPVIAGDRILVPVHGRGTVCVQVKNGSAKLLWDSRIGHWYQSFSVWQEMVCVLAGNGNLACLDLETGKQKWSVAVPTRGVGKGTQGAFSLADGNCLALGAGGMLSVVALAPDAGKVLSQAQVLDVDNGKWKCQTAPVLANGRIYCRNSSGHLVCLDVRN